MNQSGTRLLALACFGLMPVLSFAAEQNTPVVMNPRVTCSQWPSNYDAKSWINDVWRLENAKSGEEKTLALYKWIRRQCHWGDQIYDGTRGTTMVECDAVKKLAVNPYGYCVDFGIAAAAMGQAGGLKCRESHIPGHTQLEVFYKDADGIERWHRLDPFWGIAVYDKTGSHLATWQEIKADPTVALEPTKKILPWGDKKDDRKRFAEKGAAEPSNRLRPAAYTMDKPLYAGEVYTLRWKRHDDVAFVNANPTLRDDMSLWGLLRYEYAGGDLEKLAYGHEDLRPYLVKEGGHIQVPPAHGTLEFKPRLDSEFGDSLFVPAVNVAAARQGDSKLHPATAGEPAELVYLVQTPYKIAGSEFTGAFQAGPGDSVKVSIAYCDWRKKDYLIDQVLPDAPEWRTVWESDGSGSQKMELLEEDLKLRGEYRLLVKIEMTAAKTPESVSVDALSFNLIFQEGVMSLPRLMPGANMINLTGGKVAKGYKLKVTYNWDDAAGKGQTKTQAFAELPASFPIETKGKRAADVRTNFVSLEAIPN